MEPLAAVFPNTWTVSPSVSGFQPSVTRPDSIGQRSADCLHSRGCELASRVHAVRRISLKVTPPASQLGCTVVEEGVQDRNDQQA